MSTTRPAGFITCLALVFCAIATGAALAQPQSTPKADKKPEPTFTLSTKPDLPAAGEATFTVTARDAAGRSITGADVSVELVMPPTGGMGEMKNKVTLKASADPKLAAEGTYTGAGQIMMAGKWNVTVDVKVGGKSVAQSRTTLTAK
jgi:YtkA-like